MSKYVASSSGDATDEIAAGDRLALLVADLAVQRGVGFYPSGGLGIVLLIVLVLLLTRRRV